MPTELSPRVRRVWQALSEVPGWPDAPLPVRVRRLWPMLLPCAGMVGLLGWSWAVQRPQWRAEVARHADVVRLDADVAALRLELSDQQAAVLTREAEAAAATLLPSVDAVGPFLRQLHERIRAAGWEPVFQVYDGLTAEPPVPADLQLVSVRVEMRPLPENPAPFSRLRDILGAFSTPDRRIDLTRLAIRADESGDLVADFNLRLGCRVQDEKAPE